MSDTIFTRIINRQIPATILHEDEHCIVIQDIQPQAPVHLLVIPRKVIPTLNDLESGDEALVGHLFRVAAEVMRQQGHGDYRAVFNCGAGAQQTVFHLHLHVLAGRAFSWPPG
jgi:histidine triad (HIT) family protein